MPDKDLRSGAFDSDEPGERALWEALRELPQAEPSARLRSDFLARLERAGRPSALARLQSFLGLHGTPGWITATACVLVGIAAGQLLDGTAGGDAERLNTLEDNVAMLNRTLILDRLDADTASKRLRGVLDAAQYAAADPELAQALLELATRDRAPLVRTAAIDALGSQLNAPSVGEPLMAMLQEVEAPLVQLALVDLVLRNGSREQLDYLIELADSGRLDADVGKHVLTSLQREII